MSGESKHPSMKERVRMALAEAGYPDAFVTGPPDEPSVALSGHHAVPDRACWQAFKVARCPDQPCWTCWSQACGDDTCDAPSKGTEDCGHEHGPPTWAALIGSSEAQS